MAKDSRKSAASAIDELTRTPATPIMDSPDATGVVGDMDTAAEARQAIELEQLRVELEAERQRAAALQAEVELSKKNAGSAASVVTGSKFYRVMNDGILLPDSNGKTLNGIVSLEEMLSNGVSQQTVDRYLQSGILAEPDFTGAPEGWQGGFVPTINRPAPGGFPGITGEKVPVGQGQIGTLTRQVPDAGRVYA